MGFDAMINMLRSASLRIRIQYMFQKKSLSMFVLACLLAACGGGGDSSSSSSLSPAGIRLVDFVPQTPQLCGSAVKEEKEMRAAGRGALGVCLRVVFSALFRTDSDL